MELYREVQENVVAQDRADTKAAEIFAFFDEVRVFVVPATNIPVPPWLAGCGGLVAIGFWMLICIAIDRSTRNGRSFLWRMCRRGRC
jgi:hypothetical protein